MCPPTSNDWRGRGWRSRSGGAVDCCADSEVPGTGEAEAAGEATLAGVGVGAAEVAAANDRIGKT